MNSERLLKVIQSPHVSEKSARLNADNQYVFEVSRDANKAEVKKAVEELFEVKVANVRILNTPGKAKGFRMISGRRPGWKKAYVRLAEGETIDVMGGAEA